MRVHRPDAGELFLPSELESALSVLDALRLDVQTECSGASVVWATATISSVSAEYGVGTQRCVVVHAAYAVPTRVRLGLHAWKATREGERQTPNSRVLWVAHEVEKAVRTATRQSWFNLNLLGGAQLMKPEGVWSQLPHQLPELMAIGSVHTLLNVAQGYQQAGWNGEALRIVLAAARLARTSLLCLHVPGQFQDTDRDGGFDRLVDGVHEALDGCALPELPAGYDDVSRWLVAARLEQCRAS